MKQILQYDLENEFLKKYIGKIMTPELNQEINNKLIKNKINFLGYKLIFTEIALVYVLDDNKKILAIGGSRPDDLNLDQMGNSLAGLIGAPTGSTFRLYIGIRDDGGTNRQVRTYGRAPAFTGMMFVGNQNSINTTSGGQVQIGSGSTPPTRAEFTLETPFGSAPENSKQNFTNTSVYNSGLGQITNTRTIGATGGSGTINETVCFTVINSTTALSMSACIFRDLISPAVPFSVGQNVTVQYTIQL